MTVVEIKEETNVPLPLISYHEMRPGQIGVVTKCDCGRHVGSVVIRGDDCVIHLRDGRQRPANNHDRIVKLLTKGQSVSLGID